MILQSAALYKDEGVSEFTLNAALRALQAYGLDCDCVSSSDILSGALKTCDLFVMPGGADEPYDAKLGDEGAHIIRDFVTQGGAYLGLCAGAYYACDYFEFNKGHASEICGERPLKLFKGWAKGSITDIAPLYDLTLDSASVTDVMMSDETFPIYYHGGPVFMGFENDPDADIIGVYKALPANQNAAIIYKNYAKGCVILCGPHPEVSADDFAKRITQENNPQDYANILNDLGHLTTDQQGLLEKILSLMLRRSLHY